jgi:uncharacterized membrane protein YfcA
VSWHDFSTWQWVIAFLGAILVGVSKTGIAGLGVLFVVLFAQIMPAKQATGIVLPLLCFGDVIAVSAYRRHASWPHVWRVLPWTAAGVVIGAGAMRHLDNDQVKLLIGLIVVALVGLHLYRRVRNGGQEAEHAAWFAPTLGILAGFTTMVANAAGPLMAIYLLAMRLPKMEYVGTAAMFFLLINLFKVPFMVGLGLITPPSFTLNLILAPGVGLGALLGKILLAKINQRVFENLALGLAALAGLKLLLF